MRRLLGAAILLVVSSAIVYAQATRVPITAKFRVSVYAVTPGGDMVLRSIQREGVFLRSSNGSEIEKTCEMRNGQQHCLKAELRLPEQGKAYSLDYVRREAVLKTSAAPWSGRDAEVEQILRRQTGLQEMIGGLACIGIPIRAYGTMLNPGDQGKAIGTAWKSLEYNFLVKTEYANGPNVRTVMERYDIQVGVEADPREFQVPADYSVKVGAAPAGPCCKTATGGR